MTLSALYRKLMPIQHMLHTPNHRAGLDRPKLELYGETVG